MSSESKFFYANSLEAAVSAYDVSLKFGRNVTINAEEKGVTGVPQEAQVTAAERLVVSMSPSHAKAMLPALVLLVREYEKNYGKIPLATDAQTAWDSVFFANSVPK